MSAAPDGHEPVRASPLEVTCAACGGDGERMVRRFLRLAKAEGVLREHIDSLTYRKPSERKRLKRLRRAKRDRRKSR